MLILEAGSIDVVPLDVGLTSLPYAVTRVTAAGAKAVCTYANLS